MGRKNLIDMTRAEYENCSGEPGEGESWGPNGTIRPVPADVPMKPEGDR